MRASPDQHFPLEKLPAQGDVRLRLVGDKTVDLVVERWTRKRKQQPLDDRGLHRFIERDPQERDHARVVIR